MPEPLHRDPARRFVVGVAVLLVVGTIGLFGTVVQMGGELPGKSYTYVNASFDNVGMLKPQQTVSQHGRRIGTVTSIAYRKGKAVVTMRLDGERTIYRDARATIVNDSAVGKKGVYLDPGRPAAGPLGDRTIPPSQTRDSVALDDVFSVFDDRTRAALRTGLRELGGGLVGHSEDLHDIIQTAPESLDSIGKISRAAASPQARLPELLTTANRLAKRFHGRGQELSALLEHVDSTFRAVHVDGGRPLSETLQALPSTLREAREGLTTLNQPLSDLRAAVTTVRPGAAALGGSTDDVRGVLREAVGPLEKVPGVSEQASPAVDDLTHTVADARPLIPRLARTVTESDVLLRGLAPYASDAGRFFSEYTMLAGHFSPQEHYFSAMMAFPGTYNASLPDPTVKRVPYPEPGGGAWRGQPAAEGDR